MLVEVGLLRGTLHAEGFEDSSEMYAALLIDNQKAIAFASSFVALNLQVHVSNLGSCCRLNHNFTNIEYL